MREGRIPRKIIHTKMEGKCLRKPRIRRIDQIIKDTEMRGGNWDEIQENRKWKNRQLEVFL